MEQNLVYWIKSEDGKLSDFIINLTRNGNSIITIVPIEYRNYVTVNQSTLIEAIIITIK